jgi:hypothetical protein
VITKAVGVTLIAVACGIAADTASSSPAVARVDSAGVIGGFAPVTTSFPATSTGQSASASVGFQAPAALPVGDLVVFPNEEVAFILGPQLRSGSASNPWPWFDANELVKGLEHGNAFPVQQPADATGYYEAHYYDLTLALYIEHARTGDARFQTLARKVADSWYGSQFIRDFSNDAVAPRAAALSGLMMRALDGRPEMWPGITKLAREQYNIWLGSRLNYPQLHYGVRDGGFALLHVAQLAKVHPDAAVRAEMQGYALAAARDYYARLQKPDGGWYWDIEDGKGHVTAQPMMVGMLLEGLVAVHQLTGDPTVAQSILRATDWLWDKGYDQSTITNLPNLRWRAMRYFVIEGQPLTKGGSAFLYGMQDGGIRDARQLNPEVLHAFGYAYKITGDAKFKTRGDEMFAATYGKRQGPGADAYYGLADYRAKEYNVSYRSGGRYLAWRQ